MAESRRGCTPAQQCKSPKCLFSLKVNSNVRSLTCPVPKLSLFFRCFSLPVMRQALISEQIEWAQFVFTTKFDFTKQKFEEKFLVHKFLYQKSIRIATDTTVRMSLVLAKRMPLRSADFQRILRPDTFLNQKSALRSGILFASTELMHRPRSDFSLHFDIRNI